MFFEKQERTLSAVVSTPLRFSEYLTAKLTPLVLISLIVAFIVPTIGSRDRLPPLSSAVAVVLGTRLMRLVGFAFATVRLDQRLVPRGDHPTRRDDGPPVLYYSGVWPSPLAYDSHDRPAADVG